MSQITERRAEMMAAVQPYADRIKLLEKENASLQQRVEALEDEMRSLRAFKAGVDYALNSGDGSYRP